MTRRPPPEHVELTPEFLARVYDLLHEMPPFLLYNLPDSSHVRFLLSKSRTHRGWFHMEADQPVITISSGCHETIEGVIRTMAHEMCHLLEQRICPAKKSAHTQEWHRLADLVCSRFKWDRKLF